MTANSFTSVSLNPPLVPGPPRSRRRPCPRSRPRPLRGQRPGLRPAPPVAPVLHPRRREVRGRSPALGPTLPLLEGTVAAFICRRTQRVDAGDHVLFLGEVESYDAPGGEPLVFHSGFYRLATKHPDL